MGSCHICERIELLRKKAKPFLTEVDDGFIVYTRPKSFIFLSKKGQVKKLKKLLWAIWLKE